MVEKNDAESGLFSTQVFNEVQLVLRRIVDHPFNQELAAGTLSKERFCEYMQQDSLYLIHFSRALAMTAARFSNEARIGTLLQAAEGALLAERSLHAHYFQLYDVPATTIASPACQGYSAFLLATAALESAAEALAALLPCFWIYREVGRHIAENSTPANPYAKWIETYSDEGFAEAVDRFTALVDAVAAESTEAVRFQMKRRFMTASHYEYFFWDDAYRQRRLDCTCEPVS